METAIRWSPGSTDSKQRFLIVDVVGKSLKLCNVIEYKNRSLDWEEISRSNKLPAFRAFDWSPANEDLVAVGQWSGETTLFSLNNRLQPLSIPIRSQRQCNAVAFNKTSLLATGLERVRNDFCLNVFDIQHGLNSHSQSGSGKQGVEPIRKLATSEGITSIKFFPSQQDLLVAGVKGTCVRLYDLRENIGNHILQYPTTCVHNLAVDPTDENYFVSAGPPRETAVHVWDRRSAPSNTAASLGSGTAVNPQDGPVLELKSPFSDSGRSNPANLWSLRYCSTESGCLGVLTSSGQFRIIRTKQGFCSQHHVSGADDHAASEIFSPAIPQLYVSHEYDVEPPFSHSQHHRGELSQIVSFDFTNLHTSLTGRPCAIFLRGSQEVGTYELQGRPPALAVSVRNEVAVTDTHPDVMPPDYHQGMVNGMTIMGPDHAGTAQEQSEGREDDSNHHVVRHGEDDQYSQTAMPASSTDVQGKFSLGRRMVLNDIPRRRCAAGYLFDCNLNMKIDSDSFTQAMWAWIRNAKKLAREGGMCSEKLDFSYLGIYDLWIERLGQDIETRTLSKTGVQCTVSDAIKKLAEGIPLGESSPQDTSKPKHRQLCLHTCSLALYDEEKLVARVNQLSRGGNLTEGAFLALLYGNKKLAFDALCADGHTEAHRTLSVMIMSGNSGHVEKWLHTAVEGMMKDETDPFYRSILSIVDGKGWEDVLEEGNLPLRYNVGVALMKMNDKELTNFIINQTEIAVAKGLQEGVLLTGLGEKAMDLFQNYMNRTEDLQTAVLAMSHTAPLYLRDPRFLAWREEYRLLMNSWKMFRERVTFDVQSTKMAITWDGTKLLQPMPRQFTLRCNNCDQALHRDKLPSNPPTSAGNSRTHAG
ncbi:MAG: hypothetical protein Q9187_003874, partial [Circinaria calcarea]